MKLIVPATDVILTTNMTVSSRNLFQITNSMYFILKHFYYKNIIPLFVHYEIHIQLNLLAIKKIYCILDIVHEFQLALICSFCTINVSSMQQFEGRECPHFVIHNTLIWHIVYNVAGMCA